MGNEALVVCTGACVTLDARKRPEESPSPEQSVAAEIRSAKHRRGRRMLILEILVATVLGLAAELFQRGGSCVSISFVDDERVLRITESGSLAESNRQVFYLKGDCS